MNYFEKLLLNYLWDGQLEMKITGFDMEGFKQAVQQEIKDRLEAVEDIAFLDDDLMTNAEKVVAIKKLFQPDSPVAVPPVLP